MADHSADSSTSRTQAHKFQFLIMNCSISKCYIHAVDAIAYGEIGALE